MNLDSPTLLLAGSFIGVVATALIDLWLLLLGRLGLPVTNWAMVGRWFAHIPRGRLIHSPITASAPVCCELSLGWAMHYLIGVFYGVLFLYLVQGLPTLPSAIVFGLATVLVPYLLLQPGLGAGLFARRTPRPWLIRGMSLSVHSLFGVGLWAGWELFALLATV